jgi:MFS family permease
MSYTGCVGILTQTFVVDWATRRFDDRRIVAVCVAGGLLSFLLLAFASEVWHLAALLAPLYVSSALLSTVNTAQLTKAAPSDAGSVVAIDMSVGSFSRMLSPAIATAALQRSGYASVCGLSSASLLILLLLLQAKAIDAAPHASVSRSAHKGL